MPVFYGMLLANQLAGDRFLHVQGKLEGVNATAYAAQGERGYKVAVFNKDAGKAVDLSVRAPGKMRRATAWRLQAPELEATEGVTLAGAEILEHGAWSPKAVETVAVKDGVARIQIPASSAALVFLS
jgi:hypothetical protein